MRRASTRLAAPGSRPAAVLAALVAIAISVAVPASVLAARSWTVVASTDELVLGENTAVRLTVTNTSSSGSGLACVEVEVPSDFEIASVAVVSVRGQSGGGLLGWTAAWSGGSTVAFKTTLGLGALNQGDVAVFRIAGAATQAGVMSWTAVASDSAGLPLVPSCGSADYPPKSLDFDVIGPLPTATPTPAPTKTAAPTPKPTPGATPTRPPIVVVPSLPIPTPPPIVPTPRPTATPAPTSGGSSDPEPSFAPTPAPSRDDAVPSNSPGSGAGDPNGSTGGGLVAPARRSRGDTDGAFDGAVFDTLNGLPGGLVAWAYPAFVISVPGVLLLLAVAAQAVGAFAWLPLIRRRLGEFGLRRDGGPS